MANINNVSLGTSNLGSGQNLRYDYDPKVVFRDPDQQPIMTLLSKMNSRQVDQPVYNGEESPHHDLVGVIDGNQTAGSGAGVAKALDVSDGTQFQVDFVVAIGGVNCVVTSISSNAVTFDPVIDSETIPATTDLDEILIVGIAKDEGYALPEEFQSSRDTRTNYIQEFSVSWGITNTLKASKQYGSGYENRFKEEYIKKEVMFRKLSENTALGGVKRVDTSGIYNKRYTDGAKGRITTNAFNFTSGGMTNADMRTIAKSAFNHGSTRKFLFVDGDLWNDFASLLEATKQTTPTTTILGVDFTEYKTGFGTFMVKYHPYIKSTALGYDGIYLDFDYVSICRLAGVNMQLKSDVVKDGSDTTKYELCDKFGFDWKYEESHGKLIRS